MRQPGVNTPSRATLALVMPEDEEDDLCSCSASGGWSQAAPRRTPVKARPSGRENRGLCVVVVIVVFMALLRQRTTTTDALSEPPRLELTVTVPGFCWPMAAKVWVPLPLLVISPKPRRSRTAARLGSSEAAFTVRVERRSEKVAAVIV